MNLWSFVLLCALAAVSGDWIRDLSKPNGVDLGWGLNVKLRNHISNTTNSSILDNHSLMLDYRGMGISVGKVPEKDVLQVGLFCDKEEGRSKKNKQQIGEILFPIVMGFKVTGLIGITLIGITIFVVKAFVFSKLALVLSVGLLVAKFLHSEPSLDQIELDHHPSEMHGMYEHPSSSGYDGSASDYTSYSNYGTYGNYGTSGSGQEALASDSTNQYSAAAPSNASSAVSAGTESGQTTAAKRRDALIRKKVQLLPSYITVKQITVEH